MCNAQFFESAVRNSHKNVGSLTVCKLHEFYAQLMRRNISGADSADILLAGTAKPAFVAAAPRQ
jgi:hypothetical protein